jgi:hypothetical protein
MLVSPAPLTPVGSNPRPSSQTSKCSPPSSWESRTTAEEGASVLLDVLERLEAAEVDRSLDLLRIAAHAIALYRHRHCGLARLRQQCRLQPLVGQ